VPVLRQACHAGRVELKHDVERLMSFQVRVGEHGKRHLVSVPRNRSSVRLVDADRNQRHPQRLEFVVRLAELSDLEVAEGAPTSAVEHHKGVRIVDRR